MKTIGYGNDFESSAGPEWSAPIIATTPGTPVRPTDQFLGRSSYGTEAGNTSTRNTGQRSTFFGTTVTGWPCN
jgi:hypothetical protein